MATSLRVYAVQVLNTAILMLILRSEFSVFSTLPGEHYSTVNAKWYAEVGAPLVMTMVIQFATPPSVHIISMQVKRLIAWVKSRKARTQNQLNQAQAPHGFEIAAGYGEILLAASVTMIFGSGIPLLYHVAAVGFFVRYNVDKWVITRVTRKPPLYSKDLFDNFDEVFAVLLLVHVAMATYFMASAGGERPSTSFIYIDSVFLEDGLLANFHPHVWPVFGVFLLVVLGVTCKFISNLSCFEKCCEDKDADEMEENLPPFVEAYAAGLIINEVCACLIPANSDVFRGIRARVCVVVSCLVFVTWQDDDYMMDQYEDMMDFIEAFTDALDLAKKRKQAPFKGKDGKKFHKRVRQAVSPVLKKGYVTGPDAGEESKAEMLAKLQADKRAKAMSKGRKMKDSDQKKADEADKREQVASKGKHMKGSDEKKAGGKAKQKKQKQKKKGEEGDIEAHIETAQEGGRDQNYRP